MSSGSDTAFQFTITGEAMQSLVKQLKPAFPRKKEAAATVAVLKVSKDRVACALPGAQVGVPAVASETFAVELPFSELQWLASEKFNEKDQLVFKFAPGEMTFRGLKITNPRIRFGHVPESSKQGATQPSATPTESAPSSSTTAIVDPMEGVVGLPLLVIYRTLKKYPPGTFTGNQRLQAGEVEIEKILNKAHKLLSPLGLGRADIEALLNRETTPD